MTFQEGQEEEAEDVEKAEEAEEDTSTTAPQDNSVTAGLHLQLSRNPPQPSQKRLLSRKMVGVLFQSQRRITVVEAKVHVPSHLELVIH